MVTNLKIKKVEVKKSENSNKIPNYHWLKTHMHLLRCAPEFEDLNKQSYPEYIQESLRWSTKLVTAAYESCDEYLTNTSTLDLLRTIYLCTFYFYDRIAEKFGQRFYIEKPHVLINGSDMIITVKGIDGRYYGRLPGANFLMKIEVQIGRHTERDDVPREIDICKSIDVYSGGSHWKTGCGLFD